MIWPVNRLTWSEISKPTRGHIDFGSDEHFKMTAKWPATLMVISQSFFISKCHHTISREMHFLGNFKEGCLQHTICRRMSIWPQPLIGKQLWESPPHHSAARCRPTLLTVCTWWWGMWAPTTRVPLNAWPTMGSARRQKTPPSCSSEVRTYVQWISLF